MKTMFIKRKKAQKIRLRGHVKKEFFILYFKWALRIFSILALVFGAIFIMHLIRLKLSNADFFNLDHVRIKGVEYLSESDILNILKITDNTDNNVNIFSISKKDVEANLKSLAELKSAKLIKYYPNKLVIKIKERTPVFVTSIGSEFFYVDEYGVLLKYEKDIPLIFIDYKLIQVANKYDILLDFRHILYQKFPHILERIEKIDIDANFFMNLTLKNGIILKLINIKEYSLHKNSNSLVYVLNQKFRFFKIVEQQIKDKNIIDLRYFENVEDMVIVS